MAPPRPQFWLFGIEPTIVEDFEQGSAESVTYHVRPSDAEVNELLNTCTLFLQTSEHEGFCLPILEAMSAGAPVVCTNAHGNVDFCVDGENCLMPPSDRRSVREAVERVLTDADLRERLREGGRKTAAEYAWPRKLDELDAFYRRPRRAARLRRDAATGQAPHQGRARRTRRRLRHGLTTHQPQLNNRGDTPNIEGDTPLEG